MDQQLTQNGGLRRRNGAGVHIVNAGPSRAIYSYNGNLHKFYASYGTINEKQLIEMKHSALKVPPSSNSNDKNSQCSSEETNGVLGTQSDLECPADDTKEKGDLENSTGEVKLSDGRDDAQLKNERDSEATDEKLSPQKEGKLPTHDEINHSVSEDSKGNGEVAPGKENQTGKEEESQTTLAKASNSGGAASTDAPIRPSPHEMLYRERRYCDCMARYGAVYHYSQLPRSTVSQRCNRYGLHDRAMGRYNRKLMMRCKLKQPNDVPIELFAAKRVSSGSTSTETGENLSSNNDVKSKDINQDSTDDKFNCQNDSTCMSRKPSQVSEEEVSSAGCTETTSLSSMAEFSAPKESLNQPPNTTVSSSIVIPLKHMSRFTAQTSTSVPLGSPYNGKSKQADHVEDNESTSISSDQTTSEQDFQDPDGVSISSKSSLLPSSPEKSMTSRDLTRSPLWRPFKSSIIGRKRLSDDDRSSNEDNSKSQHSKGHDSTNEDSQESPSTSLKSVFSNKRSFSKSGAESRKMALFNKSTSNENVSSESTSSSASPSLKEKRRQQNDSSRSSKSKTSFSRKLSSSKAQSLQKNSKTLLLSPAKAVRSLVFRNAQKRNSRVRKVQDDKTQHGDFTPAKLPLLSSPNTEPSPLESSITAAKPPPIGNSSDSTKVNPAASASATDVSSVLPSSNVLTAASAKCSASSVSTCTSNPISQASSYSTAAVAKLSNISSIITWSSSKAGDSRKEQPSSGSTHESSNYFTATEPNVNTPLISSPAISSTSPATAAQTTTMASSSSPCGSPSVRPKEPKKPKIRLKGKHRSRASESIMLLAADSDE